MAENAKTLKSDFTCGSILGKMISFMLPVLGALVLQAAYGAVDLLVVGRFGTTAGLSGVSTGSQLLNLATFIVTALAMGITVLIARYIGEKQSEKIASLIGGSTLIFGIAGAVIFVMMIFFARPLALLLQSPAEAVESTVTYIRICGGGIFFIIAYNVLSAIFRGLGDSRSPLIFVAIACLVNIAGDLLFVAVFKMDVAGAAIATVLAQAISVIFALVMLKKKKLDFKISKKDFCFNEQCSSLMKIGTPLALQECLTQLSFLALCAFINRLGLEASSGYGVANKIVSFVMLVPGALMQSMASFVAQNVGAGKHRRARKSMFTGILIGAAIGIPVFFAIILKGDVLVQLFTVDKGVIERGFEYLKGFSLESVVTAVLFSLMGFFNGYGKSAWVMIQGLLQTLLVRLPFAYIMSIQENASLTKIGLSAPVATLFGIVLNAVFYIIMISSQKKTEASFMQE